MNADFGLILDGVILVFLAVTIFYASRLTIFLKNFRQSRATVEKLIKDLSTAIDKAELAIHDMHENSRGAENNLQNIVNEASFLSDELRFINETGDNLADRLQKLAERNRELVDQLEDNGGVGRPKIKIDKQGFNHLEDEGWNLEIDDEVAAQSVREDKTASIKSVLKKQKPKKKSSFGGFMISDRQFDEEETVIEEDDQAWSSVLDDDHGDMAGDRLISQAERDLYEALNAGKNNSKKTRIKESA
ncbi:MAG: hypothetical protein CMH31_04425 [Micavibrio sp.]|nr:hypothetical protein [Micavibrio sp.]|tara:strand:- start:65 stop:802 length:738 start_codon:yes stop_codon:yes gene_type:complete